MTAKRLLTLGIAAAFALFAGNVWANPDTGSGDNATATVDTDQTQGDGDTNTQTTESNNTDTNQDNLNFNDNTTSLTDTLSPHDNLNENTLTDTLSPHDNLNENEVPIQANNDDSVLNRDGNATYSDIEDNGRIVGNDDNSQNIDNPDNSDEQARTTAGDDSSANNYSDGTTDNVQVAGDGVAAVVNDSTASEEQARNTAGDDSSINIQIENESGTADQLDDGGRIVIGDDSSRNVGDRIDDNGRWIESGDDNSVNNDGAIDQDNNILNQASGIGNNEMHLLSDNGGDVLSGWSIPVSVNTMTATVTGNQVVVGNNADNGSDNQDFDNIGNVPTPEGSSFTITASTTASNDSSITISDSALSAFQGINTQNIGTGHNQSQQANTSIAAVSENVF